MITLRTNLKQLKTDMFEVVIKKRTEDTSKSKSDWNHKAVLCSSFAICYLQSYMADW